MDGATVLVTGGAGFIGASLANYLADRNEVIAIDDESMGTPANLREEVDYRRRNVLEDDLPTAVDTVVHLAARSSYGLCEDDPAAATRVNVEGFVNTVEQARADGCESVVYASTSSLYGSRTEPTAEGQSVTVNTAYEASKRATERYAEYFATGDDLTLAGLRLFSIYAGFAGTEAHKGPYANVIAQFADAIAMGRQPTLYGDGSQTRDFTHVDDAVRAIELAADHGLDGVFNVGTGERYSFNEVVKRVNDELDTDVAPEYVSNPIPEPVYVQHTCADHSKLTAATGWSPRVGFREGIRRVCAGYD